MAVLVFDAKSVERLVEHALCAPEHEMGWASEATPKPALQLVGDQGVYLMSNGRPPDKRDAQDGCFVAYARGLNPHTDPDWWQTKRATYGGDDGADILDVIDDVQLLMRRGETEIRIEIDENHIGLLMPDVSWITPGLEVRVRSGLGGMFTAIVLERSEHDALVRHAGNAGDFDDAKPYRVKLGQLLAANSSGGA